ncbi:MAG TPA: hypothetical protein VFJ16_22150 [Longimicrobium sp.]|nr:hypothetical protein [Longimicrobium sp.]
MLSAECWVLGAGCWVLGAGCRVPETRETAQADSEGLRHPAVARPGNALAHSRTRAPVC